MTVLVFGARGYLGRQFLALFPESVASEADIADSTAVAAALEQHRPAVVINAAGKTGRPNVDWCEDHREETVRSNVTGPLVLLEECAKRGIYWVHVGSGCIFEGDNGGAGFTEDDEPNYVGSFYSRSKLWCDQVLREFPLLLLRLRMPFDGTRDPRNLITKISKYDRLLDVDNSMTYLPDFLDVTRQLVERRATGVYHVVNPGRTSPYRIMLRYREIVDPTKQFERLQLEDLSEVAKTGRSNCVLSTARLETAGIALRPIETVVDEALHHLSER